jgi:GDPmannose 4,6-dehydratase
MLVRVAPRYFRPTEVDFLVGDASKARRKLGWTATTSFAEMVAEMVDADMAAVRDEQVRRNRHD